MWRKRRLSSFRPVGPTLCFTSHVRAQATPPMTREKPKGTMKGGSAPCRPLLFETLPSSQRRKSSHMPGRMHSFKKVFLLFFQWLVFKKIWMSCISKVWASTCTLTSDKLDKFRLFFET